jgi:TRAP-type uncharacterized transport system fused permease subunit
MMSMVTPPVALAAYAAASIAGSNIMSTGVTAFRFALVGFTLPYMFVFRPELLMLADDGGPASWSAVAAALITAMLGVVPFAAAISGQLFRPLTGALRAALLLAAALLLLPADRYALPGTGWPVLGLLGAAILAAVAWVNRRGR